MVLLVLKVLIEPVMYVQLTHTITGYFFIASHVFVVVTTLPIFLLANALLVQPLFVHLVRKISLRTRMESVWHAKRLVPPGKNYKANVVPFRTGHVYRVK